MSIARKLIPSDSGESFPMKIKVSVTSGAVFTLPLVDYGALTPNIVINWGDGTSSGSITSSTDAARIHTYASAGEYIITISGFMPGFKVNNNSAIRTLITEIVQWGIVGLRTFDFYGCNNLSILPGSAALSAVGGYTGLNEVISFASSFRATGISSIPADIFDYSTYATTFSIHSHLVYKLLQFHPDYLIM